MNHFVCFLITICISISVLASDNGDSRSLRFSGVPAIGYAPDTGFGGGVIGNMYIDEGELKPYKTSLGLKIYLTTKGVNSHAISFDEVNAFGLPLRLLGRIGFYSTIAENYCGRASDANCSQERAGLRADQLGLFGQARDKFLKHYYQNRFMSSYGELFARWLLWKDEAKLELMASYRGNYYLERDFSERGPYEGSLYQTDFKDEKNSGYLSTLEIGLMLDKRDNEPAPSSGYWVESSLRGGSWIIGSGFNYIAGNLAGRLYFPLDGAKRIVLASQSIIDIIHGDLPYDALSRIGGSQSLYDYNAIGGQYIGRGISEKLFVGRIKAIEQLELRFTFLSFLFFEQHFDLTAAAFGDVGMTAWDFSRFSKDMRHVYPGFGGGLRIHWNKTFVIRTDLAASPREDFSPKFYLVVGNIF